MLFTHMCLLHPGSVILILAKGRWCCAAGKVTVVLIESNGSRRHGFTKSPVSPTGWRTASVSTPNAHVKTVKYVFLHVIRMFQRGAYILLHFQQYSSHVHSVSDVAVALYIAWFIVVCMMANCNKC